MLNFDLFNGETPHPTVTGMASLINPNHGFIDWWLSYPRTNRKVAKPQCLQKWIKLGCAGDATLIKMHTEWMKAQPDWLKDNGAFICAPLVYLNQQRWVDFEPAEVKTKPAIDPELARLNAEKLAWKPPSADQLATNRALRAKLRGVV